MATERRETFQHRALERGIETRTVDPDRLEDTLREIASDPVVASDRSIHGVELPPWVTVKPGLSELEAASTGVTPGTHAIASEGSVLLPVTRANEGPVSLYPDHHVVVVRAADILSDIPAAFDAMGDQVSAAGGDVVVVTGPSSTSDLGESVTGIHGPSTVSAILLEP